MPEPRSRWWPAAALLVLVLAAFLRLHELELRPPHHDEGVNGWMAEKILRDGYYRYDPTNYHGPSYFYGLAASRELLGFGVWQLRLPTAIAGIALCMLPLLLRRRCGWPAAVAACALLAVSPTLVYYARYAIHETWLAGLGLFTAVCVLRWADHGRSGWLLAAAAAVALMIATKETAVIFLAVAGLWLTVETTVESIRARHLVVLGRRLSWTWRVPALLAGMLAIVAAIHVLLFTAAFQQPGSISDQLASSVRAYLVWTDRGTDHGGHTKDGCYYLHLGVRYELPLYVAAVLGLVTGFRQRWIRATGVVGFGMLGAYSLISYKMPWLPLSWLVLLALPASHGLRVVGRVLADEVSPRLGARVALVIALVPALVITRRSSFERPADPAEHLAYVHTDPEFTRWFGHIETGARAVGRDQLVVAIDHGAVWPLPWMLAPYPKTRWFVRGDEDVIVVARSRVRDLESRLGHRYLRHEYRVRNGTEPALVYLRTTLFERLVDARRFETVGREPVLSLAAR